MTIYYTQLYKTPWYILGRFNINGEKEHYDTIELTETQIPGNIMRVTLLRPEKGNARILALVTEDYDYDTPDANAKGLQQYIGCITKGISYRSLKDQTGLLVGVKDFPGSLTLSRKIYDRLVDRIEKCLSKPASRREVIQFIKQPSVPLNCEVHPYWLGDPKHGCGETTIHCEVNLHGDVLVYDGDELIKVHTLEDQKRRYQESANLKLLNP